MGWQLAGVYDSALSEFAGLGIDEQALMGDAKDMELVSNQLGIEFCIEYGTDKWRGVGADLMWELGAREGLDATGARVVLLPVKVGGELVGGVKALFHRGKPSYLSSPGTWVKDYGLFPYDYVRGMKNSKSLAVVEGPRDALRLIRDGFPALAVLGANNWSPIKRDLVLGLSPNPLIMMDGDKAGRLAAQSIASSLTEAKVVDLSSISAKLGRKVDPANMPGRYVKILKARYA